MDKYLSYEKRYRPYKKGSLSGSTTNADGYWLFVDDVFVVRKEDESTIKNLAAKIKENGQYVCHYTGVFNTPFEVIDMIARRSMSFQSARLIKEVACDTTRYIFHGNVSGVSCAFRFTIIDLEFAKNIKEYIEDKGLKSSIEIDIDSSEKQSA